MEARSVFGEWGTCGVAGRSCVSRARIEGNGTRDRVAPWKARAVPCIQDQHARAQVRVRVRMRGSVRARRRVGLGLWLA